MAIVAILAATAIVNFGKNDDRDVRMEKDRLTSFVREVQNKSLAVEKRLEVVPPAKVCGFGVRKNPSENKIESFYVTSSLEDCSTNWTSYLSSVTVLNTFYPTNGITLDPFGSVFFLSPNGNTSCYNCALPTSAVQIGITKGAVNLKVTIDPSGRIY